LGWNVTDRGDGSDYAEGAEATMVILVSVYNFNPGFYFSIKVIFTPCASPSHQKGLQLVDPHSKHVYFPLKQAYERKTFSFVGLSYPQEFLAGQILPSRLSEHLLDQKVVPAVLHQQLKIDFAFSP
jgi:hypothetical protein